MKEKLNPNMSKIIEYLEKHPEGSNKYDMAEDMGMDKKYLTLDLLDLTGMGILKQERNVWRELPGGEGILLANYYTLDKDMLDKIRET